MTPKQTAQNFLQTWVEQDYVTMLDLTQITWKAKIIKKPSLWERLKDWATGRSKKNFDNSLVVKTAQYDAKSFSIKSIGKAPNLKEPVARKITADLTLSDRSTVRVEFLMICEKGAFRPDPEGKWGVNPPSIKFS